MDSDEHQFRLKEKRIITTKTRRHKAFKTNLSGFSSCLGDFMLIIFISIVKMVTMIDHGLRGFLISA